MTAFELTVSEPRRRGRREHLVSVLAFDVVADTVVYSGRRPRHLDPETPAVEVVGPRAAELVADVYLEAAKASPYGAGGAIALGRHTRRHRELVEALRIIAQGTP